jgi:RimJ/RimL family protein N-acetyltransferase
MVMRQSMLDTIKTNRLIIRKYELKDKEDLFLMMSDSKTVEFEPYLPFTYDLMDEIIQNRIKSDHFFAVILKETNQLIGNIYFTKVDDNNHEIGYVFNRNFWHKGYATEACEHFLKEAFAAKVRRVIAKCDSKNHASYQLLERLGFRREGHLIKNVYFWKDSEGIPIWKDTYFYAKLREE